MFTQRLIYGPIFIALLLGLFFLDAHLASQWPHAAYSAPPGTVIALALLVLVPPAMIELRRLLASGHIEISFRISLLAALLCSIWPWLEQIPEEISRRQVRGEAIDPAWFQIAKPFLSVRPHYIVPTVLAGSIILAFLYHTRRQQVKGAMANAGGTLLAIVYLGVLPSFLLPVCLMANTAWMVLGIIATVKAADIGAYATGHLLGRHKLIPWLSPGKTVEGFFGGLAASGLAGGVVTALFHLPLWQGAVSGIILGAAGQLGDLLESLLKRDAGVKDSGSIPGFGGVLDLFDSPLLAAPVAYWLLKLLGKM